MNGARDTERIRPGDRLPPIASRRVDSGEEVAWRLPRGARVLVFLPERPTEAERYLDALVEHRPRFRIWDGRPLIVTSGDADAMPRPGRGASSAGLDPAALPYPVVADPDGSARRRCGLAPADRAVIIADRWGEVYRSWSGRSYGDLPDPAEIEEWVRFIVTQCPECGVPDRPPGHD